MADSSHGPASFTAQANALLRKNLTFQKRNLRTNIILIAFPLIVCLISVLIKTLVNIELDKPKWKCGCISVDTNGDGQNETTCGVEYSTVDQVPSCPIPHPMVWPPFLQIPAPEYRAVTTDDVIPFSDLPEESCRRTGSCPVTILLTGANRSFGQSLAGNLINTGRSDTAFSPNSSSHVFDSLANVVLGSYSMPQVFNFLEPAFFSDLPVYIIQPQCAPNYSLSFSLQIESKTKQQEVRCVQGLHLWRNSSSEINDELFKGYLQGNSERKINEIVAGWVGAGSALGQSGLYNGIVHPSTWVQVSNAYLQFLRDAGTRILFEFVKEMPKPETKLRLDFSPLLGPLFFTWIILQLFPIILTSLVYEKELNLRIMMKMHGLGDGPYWMISYAYFLFISSAYMLCLVIFGSLIGLKFFTLNDYSIQFVFFFIFINLQISLAFLVSTAFSKVKTAAVIGYICTFGSGLLGGFLFHFFVQDPSFPSGWIVAMEVYPGFSLYRGLYDFGQYAFGANYMGTDGMRWKDLSDDINGMREVLLIMLVEWLVVLAVAYYLDQVLSLGSGVGKHPLFLLKNLAEKQSPPFPRPGLQKQESDVLVQMDKAEISQELLRDEPHTSHAIICHNIKKVYPGKDGNPEKVAVRDLSLALPRGECFGMLGPNGAGKTSFINMMIGLITPTSGTALVEGLDIRTNMDKIYTSMGVCPQHNLLWETLTGREHLLFYGRLKNLKGAALTQAVEESLKSVNLFHGGVSNQQAGKYSGGMKRRLSVAISLIGNPKVVYMDEPSTVQSNTEPSFSPVICTHLYSLF
uniref:ABC transporter domain-containing protein n=1 Tax=Nelumbo nucifera TaxID=4432 RepID=A0A822ZUC4_NELNU|nr:TPA_asm: hypothetical protein HUJ06_016413 [Nelumbo nucifera]